MVSAEGAEPELIHPVDSRVILSNGLRFLTGCFSPTFFAQFLGLSGDVALFCQFLKASAQAANEQRFYRNVGLHC